MSGFQSKQDDLQAEALLVQAPEVRDTIVEDQVIPAIRDEQIYGPKPDIRAEIHHAPDPSALAAWIDDLNEYADKHRAEAEPAKLLDIISGHSIDELVQVAKEHKRAIDAADEQTGLVPNFLPDSAIEAAAMDTHKPDAPVEIIDVKPVIDDPEWGMNGGGGGGGAPPPPGGLPEEAAPAAPPADDKPKEKGRVGKLVDRVFRRETAKQEPIKDPDKPKK